MATWSCVTMEENMSSVAELLFYRNFSDSNLIQIGKSTNKICGIGVKVRWNIEISHFRNILSEWQWSLTFFLCHWWWPSTSKGSIAYVCGWWIRCKLKRLRLKLDIGGWKVDSGHPQHVFLIEFSNILSLILTLSLFCITFQNPKDVHTETRNINRAQKLT